MLLVVLFARGAPRILPAESQVKKGEKLNTDFTPSVSASSFIELSRSFVVEIGRGGITVDMLPICNEDNLDGELLGVNGSMILGSGS